MCGLDDGNDVMETSRPHRIDPSSPVIPGPVSKRQRSGRVTVPATGSQTAPSSVQIQSIQDRQAGWLKLQAADLISQLQELSTELDAREAQLNVRASLQDSRERQFRLRQQDALTQQAEHQRAIQRLQREIEARARRLAFRQD
jgi:hypothetical protein